MTINTERLWSLSEGLPDAEDRKLVRYAADEIERLRTVMEWIVKIADANYEQDKKLRSGGARTLKRISDMAARSVGRGQEIDYSREP